MNLKVVLRTYSLLRQLSDDETALLETLRGLNDSERELMVESLLPQKVAKKSVMQRVYERCVQCGKTKGHGFHKDSGNDGYHEFQSPPQPIKATATKSARASGMAAQLSERRQERQAAAATGDDDELCPCGKPIDDNVHHVSSAVGYHPFGLPVVSAAQPSQPASSVTEMDAAGDAAHGAS